MKQYHKIQNIFNRDTITHKLIVGDYKEPTFQYLANLEWVATEKIDGTNIRLIWSENKFRISGKTDNAQLHIDLVKALEDITERITPYFLEKFSDQNVCLYGEGYGAGIQKAGINYRTDKSFILFDILINDVFVNWGGVKQIAKDIELDVVKEIAVGNLDDLVKMVQEGVKSQFGDFIAEGIIAKPRIELKDNRGSRIITKIKTEDLKTI